MKRLKLGSKTLNIKNDSLNRLIDSTLSLKEITRATLGKHGQVSLSTAGKLLCALDECRITQLAYKRDSTPGSPSKAHVFRDEIGVLVLDFSSAVYTASIILGKDQKLISERYQPDPCLSFEGNATVFLSKVGQQMALLPYSASAICTIISDFPTSSPIFTSRTSAYLPELCDMDIVNELCAQFFGAMPTLCLTHADAIACALKHSVFEPSVKGERISHILVSDTIAATQLSPNHSPAPLNLSKLILGGEASFSRSEAQDIDGISNAISHLISLMSCAYESDVIIIEYDSGRWSGIEERIASLFRKAGVSPPNLVYYDITPQAATIGGATEALSLLIKSQIKGV